MNIKSKIKTLLFGNQEDNIKDNYYSRFKKYAFLNGRCATEKQYEASITRLYHTIEKGLAYENYRAGFGRNNIELLITSLQQYSEKYDINAFFYKTALSTLHAYLEKNKEFGLREEQLEIRINKLEGEPNDSGGTILINKPDLEMIKKMNFKNLLKNRHSIRHFSDEEVEVEKIKNALDMAQYTPSACNRQGWNTYIILDKNKKENILRNQNGNRGFGEEIDKLLVITFDLEYSNSEREVFQGFIDGGMYAANLINSLYFEGIASIPLSASLSKEQEINIRKIISLQESEVLILFVGLGCYPESCYTTKSERRKSKYNII